MTVRRAVVSLACIVSAAGCGTPEEFSIAREGSVTAEPTPLTVTGGGVHLVGSDMPAGRYEVNFPMISDAGGIISKCEWVRLSGVENTPANRIASGTFEFAFQVITVEASDIALYTLGCETLTLKAPS